MRLRVHWHTRASMETGTKEDTLLKLRKVEITGFKSFFERTTVTFSGSGTTCIVGPNGCGKSNVVDAISWVLGEQSHKSLRAGRMSDCIFNGTLKRPPLGLAEVTITMEDPELAEAARFVLEATDIIEASPEGSAQSPAIVDGLNGDSAAPSSRAFGWRTGRRNSVAGSGRKYRRQLLPQRAKPPPSRNSSPTL